MLLKNSKKKFGRVSKTRLKIMIIVIDLDLKMKAPRTQRNSKQRRVILEELKIQDEALDGKRGASLWAVSTESGKMGSELKLKSPPVWDGMAVAQGRLYVATVDGKVLCFGKPK